MQWLIGLATILGTFGVPLFWIKMRYEEKKRQHELAMHRMLALPPGSTPDDVKSLISENKLLRERVENLESIVCNVDFELNQKLARVIDESRSIIGLPPSPNGPAPPPSTSKSDGALDRTATAHGAAVSKPLTTTLEPGQVIAQRYRVQRLLGKG